MRCSSLILLLRLFVAVRRRRQSFPRRVVVIWERKRPSLSPSLASSVLRGRRIIERAAKITTQRGNATVPLFHSAASGNWQVHRAAVSVRNSAFRVRESVFAVYARDTFSDRPDGPTHDMIPIRLTSRRSNTIFTLTSSSSVGRYYSP